MTAERDSNVARRRNTRTMVACLGVVAGMVGLSFASVPLYEIFCRVTGFGGTTQVSATPSESVGTRTMRIRFDATVAPGLPWAFQPEQREMALKVGENGLAYYRATNISMVPVTGTATFNVTPLKAGLYFNKVECFCFTEQLLEGQSSIDMPVAFFVDPAIVDDRNLDDVTTITLSYTFYASPNAGDKDREASLAQRVESAGDERIRGTN